ncbi:hypothetical protein GCM10010466_21220 [Planomonospora alba]|uniref:Uncharacterized protein n=1 Tax=Planomonospora alba TaxID=161354 RepID=A0ABP6N0H1_9ACTN
MDADDHPAESGDTAGAVPGTAAAGAADGTAGRRGRGIGLAVQAALFGSAVFLLDRAAGAAVADRAASTGRIADGTWTELARHGESASAPAGPVVGFFLVAAILFAPVAVLLDRRRRRAETAGLLLAGLLTPPYLAGLAVVALFTGAGPDVLLSEDTVALVRSRLPDWYVPARSALLGAAATAHLVNVFLLARAAAAHQRAVPVPGTVPLLLAHLPLVGVHVTVLGSVAIGQAGRLARQEARTAPEGAYAGPGLFYLDDAAGLLRWYGVLFAVAGALALALAAAVRRRGAAAPLPAVLGAAGIPFLLLLLVASAATPFTQSGAADEPVPGVLGSGPDWYPPALLTQTLLGAVAYLTAAVLLVRGGYQGARDARGAPG